MKNKANILFAVLSVVIISVGIFLRVAGLGVISMDMKMFVMRWYEQLARQGFSVLQTEFSNYTPPYLYLLWLATFTHKWIPEVTAIKLISILFDAGNAVWVYKIARIKYPQGSLPFLGMVVFFTLPTLILNSAWWGQADSIYTFFVLACSYYVFKNHSLPAMVFFGIAVAFKVQAVFFAPFLFLMALNRRIPWSYFLLFPMVYIALMIPAVLAGRPFFDILTIYLSQADTFRKLVMNAPNLYNFLSNRSYELMLISGLGFIAILVIFWAIIYAQLIKTWTFEKMVICGTVSTIMMPFFLPKMHERYFYLADVMVMLLVISLPRLWTILLTSQVVSTITYSIYLFSQNGPKLMQSTQSPPLLILATLINTFLVGYLFWKQYQLAKEIRKPLPIQPCEGIGIAAKGQVQQ